MAPTVPAVATTKAVSDAIRIARLSEIPDDAATDRKQTGDEPRCNPDRSKHCDAQEEFVRVLYEATPYPAKFPVLPVVTSVRQPWVRHVTTLRPSFPVPNALV